MRSAVIVALALCCIAVVAVSANPSGLRVVRGKVPSGWVPVNRAAATAELKLVFAIKQRNADVLNKILYEVSDPTHPKYGQYWSLEAINELVGNPEGSKQVQQFLLSQGVAAAKISVTKGGDFVMASMPVRVAENMLRTEFVEYQHTETRKRAIKTPAYTLPVGVADLLDFVSANCLFPTVRPMSLFSHVNVTLPRGAADTQIDGYVTPDTLFKYYGIANPVVASASATQSVYESLGQSYDTDDLASFQQQFNIPNNPIAKVIGPNQPDSCAADPNNCVEALLDVEYITAVAQNSPTTFWSMADTTTFLDWIVAVGQDANPPLVHSISYGDIEPEDDFSVDSRFDQEVQELGLRGITVVVSSGDDGVANFLARSNSSACGFNPSFPATSPHVTAVGATQGPEQSQPEIACTSTTNGLITTGGGFSVNFAQPSYQTNAVNLYKTRASLPPSNLFNIGNRGYPDVAMLGHNYITIIGGQTSAGSGTSASAPVFGAVITLANGLRLAKGKAPLGFLNQALYYLAANQPSVFRDITSGENNCCAGDPSSAVCCQYGFYAAPGWDPLTGLGSVDFASFTTALANL